MLSARDPASAIVLTSFRAICFRLPLEYAHDAGHVLSKTPEAFASGVFDTRAGPQGFEP